MRKFFSFLIICCMAAFGLSAQQVSSPDGRIQINFKLSSPNDSRQVTEGTPYYSVNYEGKPFLLPSRMGFDLIGTGQMKSYFGVKETLNKEVRNTWKPIYGERDEYPDNYNEMTIVLEEKLSPNRRLNIVFRAYNEGIAFRYIIPDQPGFEKVVINNELTEFAFPRYASVWESYGHEGKYYKVYPSEIKANCELPLTCLTESGIYGAIMEAGNSHYPRAYTQAVPRAPSTISIQLRGEAKGEHGITTAWRAITLGSTPGKLIEQNYLLLNLNEPCQIEDTSWIKPGTFMRETSLTTEGAYKLIDFCTEKGIENILFDSRWYGNDHDPHSYPGTPIRQLDLKSVIDYANRHNMGVFLYVDRLALEMYADRIFPIFQQWGVKGIKPGFVNVGNQEWQEWIENMVKLAAKYKLMVNIHDAYRPTGFSRTYPNLMTQEGIHGNEQNPNADHDAMLPFTRYTIGAGDYTPGYLREGLQGSYTHRLALPIVYYSPAEFLFWREKPDARHNREELKLWSHIPTVWNDTKVLAGAIGEYAVIARCSGNTWYVGGITDTNGRTLTIDFSFLDARARYEATIYTDDPLSDKVNITTRRLTAKDKLTLELKDSGGFAMKIEKK